MGFNLWPRHEVDKLVKFDVAGSFHVHVLHFEGNAKTQEQWQRATLDGFTSHKLKNKADQKLGVKNLDRKHFFVFY